MTRHAKVSCRLGRFVEDFFFGGGGKNEDSEMCALFFLGGVTKFWSGAPPPPKKGTPAPSRPNFKSGMFNLFKPEFTIVIFTHYKLRIAVAILDL